MIDRRELLALGGLLSGVTSGHDAAEGTATGVGQISDRSAQDVVNELKAIANAISAQQSFAELAAVRKSQGDYLRATGKFPDFIDVGLDIWMGVHDWHVRMRQPLVLGRDATGRYTLALGFTALVLRHDAAPTLIGIPYDQK